MSVNTLSAGRDTSRKGIADGRAVSLGLYADRDAQRARLGLDATRGEMVEGNLERGRECCIDEYERSECEKRKKARHVNPSPWVPASGAPDPAVLSGAVCKRLPCREQPHSAPSGSANKATRPARRCAGPGYRLQWRAALTYRSTTVAGKRLPRIILTPVSACCTFRAFRGRIARDGNN